MDTVKRTARRQRTARRAVVNEEGQAHSIPVTPAALPQGPVRDRAREMTLRARPVTGTPLAD